MSDKQAFWDSSALIPLFIGQSYSQKARLILRKHPKPVVAWTAPLEAVSAFARLYRSGLLSLSSRARAIASLDSLSRRWLESRRVIACARLPAALCYSTTCEQPTRCNWHRRWSGRKSIRAAALLFASTLD